MTVSEVNLKVQRYDVYEEKKPALLVFRATYTLKHLIALLLGGAWASLRQRRELGRRRQWRYGALRFVLLFFWPFLDKKMISQPVGVQFRKRLERMGATYIKLGQILSLREDVLPTHITDELKKLLDNFAGASL